MSKSFLENYLFYTSNNEAHPLYHIWCGLVALSSIVSRRVWVSQGYFNTYPNLYVVLDGPPGDRKTTAMNVCKDLLLNIGGIPLSAECQTKESLVKEWSTYETTFTLDSDEQPILYTPITICVTELSQFLGAQSSHMVDFLTTVYDAKWYANKTKNKGSEIINGPYVVLLGCTTPAWVSARMRDDVISGGFSRRAIFVYWPGERKRIPFPQITPEMEKALQELIAYGKHLQQTCKGPFRWEGDVGDGIEESSWGPVKKMYADWYINLGIPQDSNLTGYYETKHQQLLKLAMLHSLSESTDLVLRENNLMFAMELLAETEKNLEKVFAGVGRNVLNSISQRIVQLIEANNGKIAEKEIYRVFHKDATAEEIMKILAHLQATDQYFRISSTTKTPTGEEVTKVYVVSPEVKKQLLTSNPPS